MQEEDVPPRRRYPRIASHHSVLVRQITGESLEAFAHTKSIAVGGCSFISDERFGDGSPLELLIAVDGRVINAHAKVVYERSTEDDRIEVGVEFGALSQEDADSVQRIFERPEVKSDAGD